MFVKLLAWFYKKKQVKQIQNILLLYSTDNNNSIKQNNNNDNNDDKYMVIILVSKVSHTNAFIIMSTNFDNLINVALLLVHKFYDIGTSIKIGFQKSGSFCWKMTTSRQIMKYISNIASIKCAFSIIQGYIFPSSVLTGSLWLLVQNLHRGR